MSLRLVGQMRSSEHACYSVRYSPHVRNQIAVVSCENYGIQGRSTMSLHAEGEQRAFTWSDALFDVSFVEIDPSLMVCASGDGSILVWSLAMNSSSPLLRLREHQREVWCVHWSESRSNDALLSASADGTIKLWNINT